MMVSQRFPAHFDGVLACAPGFRFPGPLSRKPGTARPLPVPRVRPGSWMARSQVLINKTFTDDDLALVANAALAACDSLDGLADGMINDFTGCTTARVEPRAGEATCTRAERHACLSAGQVAALKTVFDGDADVDRGDGVRTRGPGTRASAERWAPSTTRGGDSGSSDAFEGPGAFRDQPHARRASLAAIFVTPPVPVASTGARRPPTA